MEIQNESSAQFDNNVQKIFDRLFKNKLTGKAYAIRMIALIGLGFALSGAISTIVTSNLNNMMYSGNPVQNSFMPTPYLGTFLLTLFGILSFSCSASFSVRRIRDIVPDTNILPYALGVVVIGLIPFLNYILYFILALLPSDYLNHEKRNQLLSKIA